MTPSNEAAADIGVLEFQSTLVLSTAHIDLGTLNILNSWDTAKPWKTEEWIKQVELGSHHYGFMLRAHRDNISDKTPECISAAIRYAADLNAHWINFDMDGSEAPGLQVYEH